MLIYAVAIRTALVTRLRSQQGDKVETLLVLKKNLIIIYIVFQMNHYDIKNYQKIDSVKKFLIFLYLAFQTNHLEINNYQTITLTLKNDF